MNQVLNRYVLGLFLMLQVAHTQAGGVLHYPQGNKKYSTLQVLQEVFNDILEARMALGQEL